MSPERGRPGGKAPRPAGHPPSAARLAEAAAAHLARFAATEAGLKRVLARRIDRWARAAEAEGQPDVPRRAAEAKSAIAEVAQRLVAGGAVDDAAFAESRARRLLRRAAAVAAAAEPSPPWAPPRPRMTRARR
jgi:regulatory protein